MYLSIIIPVYNKFKYINGTLNSLIYDMDFNVEIIIIDDGSTDKSKMLIQEFSYGKENVKCIFQENKGVSNARNVGLSVAKGEYIIFVDADDRTDLGEIGEILKESEDYELICFNYNLNDNPVNFNKKNELIINREKMKDVFLLMLKSEYLNSVCTKVYRKSLIEKNDLKFNEDISMGEDLLFNVEYYMQTSEVFMSSRYAYNYINNPESLTKKFNLNKYKELDQVYLTVEELFNDNFDVSENFVKVMKYLKKKRYFSEVKHLLGKKELTKERISFLKNKVYDLGYTDLYFSFLTFALRLTPYSLLKKVGRR